MVANVILVFQIKRCFMPESVIQCPRCGSEDIDGCQLNHCVCKNCGFWGKSLEFAFWSIQYSGDNSYLICN